MTITVLKPGLQTSIQDGGRNGYLAAGLSPAGPMDHVSLQIANLLVQNEVSASLFCRGPRGEAGLECTMMGPTLRFDDEAIVAVTGAEMPARLNGFAVPLYESFHVPAGAVIELGIAKSGVRSYLAVAGGIEVEPVLGSRSQNIFASCGPFGGRPLRAGDKLPTRPFEQLSDRKVGRRFDRSALPLMPTQPTLRVVMGPQDELFAPGSIRDFLNSPWKLGVAANRMGMRFTGLQLTFGPRPEYLVRDAGPDPSNIVDDIIPVGGIQCPSGAEAIVMGVENPTVGGFAKIATVIAADLPLAGQLRPGQTVRFQSVKLEDAICASRSMMALATENRVLNGGI
jgi:biotin-dependent carboxylase-like uncharacterized protein